jgi:hypothetical protein
MNPPIQATTAQFPGFTFAEACDKISEGVTEGFGMVQMEHVQLCPQASDFVDEKCIVTLQNRYPHTKFRLHANVRIDRTLRIFDASRYSKKTKWYYERLADLSRQLSASGYSLHAGYREDASLEEMRHNILEIQSFFPCDVMVEGMYPDERKDWLVKNWEEYQWMMESGLLYAIDLSHLNIVKKRLKTVDLGLVYEILLHPNCREVHLSHNYGNHDSHLQLKSTFFEEAWWKDIWHQAMSDRQKSGIEIPVHFTEGRCATRSPKRR